MVLGAPGKAAAAGVAQREDDEGPTIPSKDVL